MVQSCPEASPAKWHLAHTAWFFESFILREFLPELRVLQRRLSHGSSTAITELCRVSGEAAAGRPFRGRGWTRSCAIGNMWMRESRRLLEVNPEPEVLRRIELGVNHEEQHQELLLTDILHAFFTNPLRPAYQNAGPSLIGRWQGVHGALNFVQFDGGLIDVGFGGEGFCYDNELPRHRVWLEPYALADRLVTNGEFAEFIADGGYREAGAVALCRMGRRGTERVERTALLERQRWRVEALHPARGVASGADERGAGEPRELLRGGCLCAVGGQDGCRRSLSGRRRPRVDQSMGNLMDSGKLMPVALDAPVQDPESSLGCTQLFGDCWEWTASAYLGYPGFEPLEGSLGEYNGKFMSGQMVLRGGSCATPQAHIRASYRNFFAPETRWQFSGIRLGRKVTLVPSDRAS